MKKTDSDQVLNEFDAAHENAGSCEQRQDLKSGENYHNLFEQATDAIMVTDFKGDFKDVNSSFCTLFGYSKSALLLMNVRELIEADHLEKLPIRFDLLEKGENVFNERKMLHKNGRVIDVEANAKKFAENRIMVIARDITQRKEVERILQESEANLHTIFDTTDTIYVLLDKEFRIISYNPRAFSFASRELGHQMQTSEYLLDYFPQEKRSLLRSYMEEVLKGKRISYEVSYPQRDGSTNWYDVRMFLISRGNKQVFGLMMAVSDITEKKLLERELLRQKVQEQKNTIRAVLKVQEIERNKIGLELHDNVNQILTSIRLYLAMMERNGDTNPDLVRQSKELIDVAIREIRLLSREQVTPQKKFNLKELIEKLVDEMNKIAESGTRFIAEIPGHLDIHEDLKLNIYRIVQEQINNIIKHADARRAKIWIGEGNNSLLMKISDDGRGFDPLEGRKGIGISNIINRIESYNGEMNIESSPGMGCKIMIKIPHTP